MEPLRSLSIFRGSISCSGRPLGATRSCWTKVPLIWGLRMEQAEEMREAQVFPGVPLWSNAKDSGQGAPGTG